MANKENRTNIKDERIEDTTMYGEFVASTFQWITPDRQRNVARHLEKTTEDPGNADKTDKKRSR